MKWFLVVVVVLCGAPNTIYGQEQSEKKPWRELMKELGIESPYEPKPVLTVQASGGTIRHYQGKEPDFLFHFYLYPRIDVEHIRAKVRFFIPNEVPVDEVKAAKCFLAIEGPEQKMKLSRDLRNQLISGDSGTDLWIRQLKANEKVNLGVLWPVEKEKPSYATVKVGKERPKETDIWFDKTRKTDIQNMPVAERPFHYQELSLDDVCQTFAFHEAMPIPEGVDTSAFERLYTDEL